jgi:5,10-methylene-tetrahydrofolate dehydrogenase/methenyl tetrahydrofolate cyclohydrolase
MLYSPANLKIKIQQSLQELIQELHLSKDSLEFTILEHKPTFASQKYVSLKVKKASEVGIIANQISLTDFDDNQIKELVENLHQPYILQLPVDSNLNWILDQIPTDLDLDLLNPNNFSPLVHKEILPPTIRAIFWTISDFLNQSKSDQSKSDQSSASLNTINQEVKKPSSKTENLVSEKSKIHSSNDIHKIPDLRGKTVLVIGQGKLVGNPLVGCLLQTGATIISVNEWTDSFRNNSLRRLAKKADIVISAIGKPGIIKPDIFLENTFVIDAATSESDGALVGDIDKNSADKIILCPSPGGIGGLTILALFYNLYLLKKLKIKKLKNTL